MHVLNYNSSFFYKYKRYFIIISFCIKYFILRISKRLYHTRFRLNIVNFQRKILPFAPCSLIEPTDGLRVPPHRQFHFISQFMLNTKFFSILTNTLKKRPGDCSAKYLFVRYVIHSHKMLPPEQSL